MIRDKLKFTRTTLLDLNLGFHLEQRMMVSSLTILRQLHKWQEMSEIRFPEIAKGKYHSTLEREQEKSLLSKFEHYKIKHGT